MVVVITVYTMYQGVVVVITPGTKVWWLLLLYTPCTKVWWLLLHQVPRCGGCYYCIHHVPRCGGCYYTRYQGVVVVITPCTKVWWLLLHQVPSFNVAQLKINSDHFAKRHQMKDVQKLLQKKTRSVKMSDWKRNELNNGYKQIMLVAREVPTK